MLSGNDDLDRELKKREQNRIVQEREKDLADAKSIADLPTTMAVSAGTYCATIAMVAGGGFPQIAIGGAGCALIGGGIGLFARRQLQKEMQNERKNKLRK